MEQTANSVLTVEGRKRLTITHVESVDSFSESTILLHVEGKRVTISGEKLKILSFSQGGGNFAAVGEIRSVRYGTGKKFSKLFQ